MPLIQKEGFWRGLLQFGGCGRCSYLPRSAHVKVIYPSASGRSAKRTQERSPKSRKSRMVGPHLDRNGQGSRTTGVLVEFQKTFRRIRTTGKRALELTRKSNRDGR